jgi:putative transposase
MVKLRHIDHLGQARFITFSCYHGLPLLTEDLAKIIFIEELNRAREKHGFFIYGYAVMPDHAHLVIHPLEETTVGPMIGTLKSCSARRIIDIWKDKNSHQLQDLCIRRGNATKYVFWQRRCYDFNCRTIEDIREKINYCHLNPVRASLVAKPEDWKWSSAEWYQSERSTFLKIDPFEP